MSDDLKLIMDGLRAVCRGLLGGVASLVRRLLSLNLPYCRPLTNVEKALVWAGGGYFLWILKKAPIDKVLSKCLPLWSYVRSKVVGPRVKYSKDEGLNRRMMEAVRIGSDETAMTPAKSQVLIGQMKEGDFVAHGCGVRMTNFLVTPDHVLSYSRRSGETGKTLAFGYKSTGTPVSLSDKDVITIDTDLVAVLLSEAEWSVIGASVQNIYHDIPEHGAYAQVVGHKSLGTQGVLSHDPTCFGRVVYEATTMPGYSGAPYMVANRIAGLHQCGSAKVNGGYSASYVWTVLSHLEGRKDEDTADWLRNQYQLDNFIYVDQGYKDLDEVRVRVGGRYHIVERDVMDTAIGTEWRGKSVVRMPKKRTTDYGDMESENQGILKSGASDTSAKSPDLEKLIEQLLMEKFQSLSKAQFKKGKYHYQQKTTSTPTEPQVKNTTV